MKIDRETLLKELETVMAGLSHREDLEQSNCFVFKDGRVMTFNQEVACSAPTCLKITGAVPFNKFLALLQKLKDQVLEMSVRKGELLIQHKRRHAGIRFQKKIELPIETVKMPKHWQSLPSRFIKAIERVQDCANRKADDDHFATSCIHIHPKYIEASDNYQVGRFTVQTGIKRDILVRKESLVGILDMGMTKFGETKSWIHFKNKDGVILSCCRYMEEFPDMTPILKVDGQKVALPKGLNEAVDRAAIFTEDEDDCRVTVYVKPGKVTVEGSGSNGWFTESPKCAYNGPDMTFAISPTVLAYIVKKYSNCKLSTNRLKVRVGRFQYVTVLKKVEKKD